MTFLLIAVVLTVFNMSGSKKGTWDKADTSTAGWRAAVSTGLLVGFLLLVATNYLAVLALWLTKESFGVDVVVKGLWVSLAVAGLRLILVKPADNPKVFQSLVSFYAVWLLPALIIGVVGA